jgi:Histidine kinase
MRKHRRTTHRVGERRLAAATVAFMLLAALVLATTVAAAPPEPWDGTIRYQVGDDPAWASPAFDDSQWPAGVFESLPQKPNDVLWVRVKLDLRVFKVKAGHPFGIYFGGLASHELYWDGEKIGGGGVVGRTRDAERPGPVEAHYHVPDRLVAPGFHTVAVRMSAFHRGFSPMNGYWGITIGNYDRIIAMRTRTANIAVTALSGIALTGVFALAMFWLTRRDGSFLLLGALCIAAAALLVSEAWRPLFGYTYDWHIVRLRCVVGFSWLTGVLLVALVVQRFPGHSGKTVLALSAVAAAIVPWFPRGWDPKSMLIFMCCFTVAAAWTLWAAARRLHGSVLALIGVGGATAAMYLDPWRWVDNSLYFALNFLFVCLLCSHALEVRRAQHEKARLELEMLRRQLQPHFLMNTLTALSEWIEQDPKTAVRMIDSLSEELRSLAAMSKEKLVSADDELRLCRSYLANMSLRKDVAYELEVDGVHEGLRVPPAVFHTLVENAVTHGAPSERVTLRLSAKNGGGRVRYVFEAPAGDENDGAAGMGTQYIEARLREAWGNAWSFRQGREGSLWRAEIEVPA